MAQHIDGRAEKRKHEQAVTSREWLARFLDPENGARLVTRQELFIFMEQYHRARENMRPINRVRRWFARLWARSAMAPLRGREP